MAGAAKTLGMDKPMVVEQYNTGATTYLFTPKDGKWSSMPSDAFSSAVSSEEYKQQMQKTECSVLLLESVDGEPAAIFQAVNADSGSTTKAWISQTSGLVLRTEIDIDAGRGTKTHVSMSYDYKDIQLPLGAK